MLLLISSPPGRTPEREYIYQVLFKEFLGLDFATSVHESSDVIIRCADSPGPALIVPDLLFSIEASKWLTPDSLPKLPFARYTAGEGTLVPVLYGVGQDLRPSVSNGIAIKLNVDVFGSAFFLLTRYEEIAATTTDQYGRFPFSASIAAHDNCIGSPLVNHYLELLWSCLVQLWPTLERRPRSFRVLVSHDLDIVSLFRFSPRQLLRSMAADLLHRHQPRLVQRRLSAYLVGRAKGRSSANDPYDTFDWIMTVSEACGISSTFNIVPQRTESPNDPDYDLDEPWFSELLQRISGRGHAIGFHPGFGTYQDEDRTVSDFRRLVQTCNQLGIVQSEWGGRQHFLQWANPDTWNNWEAAGLNYDSTLEFPEQVGFRCGCCYEYPVFDLVGRKQLKLRERPLLVMDTTLLSYMKLSLSAAEEKVTAILRTVQQFSGDFVLLWHNNSLVDKEAQKLYARLIFKATGNEDISPETLGSLNNQTTAILCR